MLIIFDLDDTLIETSKCIIPMKLHDALVAMQNSGLNISDFNNSKNELISLNESAPSGKDAITKFCKSRNQASLAEIGINEYYHKINLDGVDISLVNGAEEIISQLSKNHVLAVVTLGLEKQQLQKIKSANLDSKYFSNIYVTPIKNKAEYYQKLMQEHSSTPKQTIVIGDNLINDLFPAKELGIHTVHLRNGRSKNIQYNENDEPSFSIKSLNEINDLIKLCKQ